MIRRRRRPLVAHSRLTTDATTTLYRAVCSCGWAGDWRHVAAMADLDFKRHLIDRRALYR